MFVQEIMQRFVVYGRQIEVKSVGCVIPDCDINTSRQ